MHFTCKTGFQGLLGLQGLQDPVLGRFLVVLRTKWPKRAQKGVQKGPLFGPLLARYLRGFERIWAQNGPKKGSKKGPKRALFGPPGGLLEAQMYAFYV